MRKRRIQRPSSILEDRIKEEDSPEDQAVLEIMKSKTSIEPVRSNGQLSIHVSVDSSLRLGEDWDIERDVFKEGWEATLQREGQQVVKKNIEHVIAMAQDHQLDYLEFGNWVRIKQPTYWKEHEKDWKKTFAELPVTVDVNFTLTGYGTQDIN